MPSLQQVNDRFTVRLRILEGGSGTFPGIVDEPAQGSLPSYQFTNGRRILRVNPDVRIKPSTVIETEGGSKFITGVLGDDDSVFKSFRLFEVTGRYRWLGRGKVIEPITGLPEDAGTVDKGLIWAAYEPSNREALDRQMHLNMESGNLITNAKVQRDDMVDDKRVIRVDHVLGITLAVLS